MQYFYSEKEVGREMGQVELTVNWRYANKAKLSVVDIFDITNSSDEMCVRFGSDISCCYIL